MAVAILACMLGAGVPAPAQSLTVLPVNVNLAAGEKASTITVVNHGTESTAIQIRIYKWDQNGGTDQLRESGEVVASPPLATIAAGGSQLIRVILRQTAESNEATYRIILDQIPAAAVPGIIRVALRMSIPIFAQPLARTTAELHFHLEATEGKEFLVAVNSGRHHEVVREVTVSTADGRILKTASSGSPYVLAGATRRWLISAQGQLLKPDEVLHLAGRLDGGSFEQQLQVDHTP